MNQTLIRINWPRGFKCPPAVFREKLAKSELFPSEFFHYGTEMEVWDKQTAEVDGKIRIISKEKIIKTFDKPTPLSGRAPVRVIGAQTWVGVIADPEMEGILIPHISSILKVASKVAGCAVKIELEQCQFGISYTEYPVKYNLRELVLKRRCEDARNAKLETLIADRIWGGVSGDSYFGIDGTCARFGFEPPSLEQLELRIFPLRNIGLHMKSSDGLSKEYVSLIDAEIWMNAKLEGVWQVGNLISRGYGRFIKPVGVQS